VPAQVVDTVGAGDSFMSATLDALAGLGLLGASGRPGLSRLSGPALDHVLRYAGTAASLTVTRAGANPPDTRELAEQLGAGA